MGISGTVGVKYQGLNLPEVRMTWGIDFPEQRDRPIREGYGLSIELPAVLDTIAAVEAGTLTATEARTMLLKLADHLYGRWQLRNYESWGDLLAWCERDGGCPDCEKHGDDFARFLDTMAARWAKFQAPDLYPFAAGSSNGIHETTCSVTRRSVPSHWARPTGSEYDRLRRAYCHERNVYSTGDPDVVDPLAFLRIDWTFMTAEEARAFEDQHIGPKGGRTYHRCRVCAPTP